MIKAESFKAIEATIASRLWKRLNPLTQDLYQQIEAAVVAQDWEQAVGLANGLSLATLLDKDQDFLKYTTNMAMLFGASRVTAKPGTSVVGMGYEAVTTQQMLLNLTQLLSVKMERYLRDSALQLIALARGEPTQKAEEDKPRILQNFASFMDDKGKAYLNIAASLHTSRVSAYGFTAEAMALGLEEYQINEQLDARTCPVCRFMHGKTFKVKTARSFLDIVTRVTDPDDLKQLQPWPKQSKAGIAELKSLSQAELESRGWHTPPFHPRCRGLLGRVGKVPSLEQIDQGLPQEQHQTTEEDFKGLGFKPPAGATSTWNHLVGKSPVEVVADLLGTAPDKLLTDLLTAGDPASISGAKGIKVGTDKFTLTLDTLLPETKEAVKQKVSITPTKLTLDEVELPAEGGAAALKGVLKRAYLLAGDLGLAYLAGRAGGAVGGYALAKYGFQPTSSQEWEALKKDIWGSLDKRVNYNTLSPAAKTVLEAVYQSTDPADIALLADLQEPTEDGTPIGEALLEGVSWDGQVPLDDEDAVTRFLTYIGELQ